MRVVWDGRVLCGQELRGMGAYTVNLLTALTVLRPQLEIVVLSDEAMQRRPPPLDRPIRIVGPARGYRWQLWERIGLPWHAWRLGADLMHSPANTTPRLSVVPRVVTVHDVIPYLPDASGERLVGDYWVRTIPRAVREAAAVLTDSECSRSDIARVFDMSPDRIHVAPLAVGTDVEPPTEDISAWLTQEGIRPPYVLALAATAPRKNTAGVLRVFKRVSRRHPELQLVLTGVGPALRSVIERAMQDLEIPSSRVRLFGFVTPEERNRLYSAAAVFLFLTLYEGFGLPILEAMRCGAPVLCSNRSSCPEVAGDAAVLVDPVDEEAASQALLAMVDVGGEARELWVARGRERERQFTWTRTAEMTLSVYDRVAN